jgi:hypothetical protein
MVTQEEKDYQADIAAFAEEKEKNVVWKTPEGKKQLQDVVKYKNANPQVSINTLVEFLIKNCGWKYTKRYIFDIIVTEIEKQNDK